MFKHCAGVAVSLAQDDALIISASLICAALAFLLSASAGLGGSLLLVPVLALLLGPKQGIAVAALLLMGNNFAKVIAFRKTIPLRAVALVLILTLSVLQSGQEYCWKHRKSG